MNGGGGLGRPGSYIYIIYIHTYMYIYVGNLRLKFDNRQVFDSLCDCYGTCTSKVNMANVDQN